VYVYYRVSADTPAVREAIDRFIDDVEAVTNVRGHLLARCDDATTWMEVYGPITDVLPFKDALARLVDRHRMIALTRDGRRHTECFGPLPPSKASAQRSAAAQLSGS
jgi:hypothetical protein